jgi:hypothetical protein
MRKQALIHYHGLVDEIATYCTEAGVPLDLEAYHAIGTRPTSIHHAKDDHKAAVFALAESITAAVAEEEREAVAAKAD